MEGGSGKGEAGRESGRGKGKQREAFVEEGQYERIGQGGNGMQGNRGHGGSVREVDVSGTRSQKSYIPRATIQSVGMIEYGRGRVGDGLDIILPPLPLSPTI